MNGDDGQAVPALTAAQRWGWEYVEPMPARPRSALGPCPQVQDPALSPRTWQLRAAIEHYRRHQRQRIALVVVPLLLALVLDGIAAWVFLLLGVVAAWFFLWPWIRDWIELQKEGQGHRAAKGQAKIAHRQAQQRWETALSTWDEDEQARLRKTKSWFPIVQDEMCQRVEVFGGTPAGWSTLLTTFADSALSTGGSLLVLDFSQRRVGQVLAQGVQASAYSVRTWSLPRDLDHLQLVSGLNAAEVADLLAEAVHTLRTGGASGVGGLGGSQRGDEVSRRLLDAQLLRKAADHLGEEITLPRLLAALDTFLRVADPRLVGPLSPREMAALVEEGELLAGVERVQDELLYLRSALDLLTVPPSNTVETTGSSTAQTPDLQQVAQDWWLEGGLVLISTDDDNARRKELIEHVLLQVLLRRVRIGGEHTDRTLVVVGADHLGQSTLEALQRRVHGTGTRCVLLLEHLRGDAAQLLGNAGSTSLIMRLGNAAEAANAAEFIGKGHHFRISQFSRQHGQTTTTGTSSGTSTSQSQTDSRSTGRSHTSGHSLNGGGGMGVGPGGLHLNLSSPLSFSSSQTSTSSTSRSVGVTHSHQQSQNDSLAQSQTDGVVIAESYTFTVEPTRLQALPETMFFLVEAGQEERRLVLGDCNPHIAALDAVDTAPRRATD